MVKYKNLPYKEKYNTKTRAKPLPVYLTEFERNKFIELAKQNKMSVSSWVKNICLSYISESVESLPYGYDDKDTIIASLQSELALLQSKFIRSVEPVKSDMSDEIYSIIKNANGSWISQDELYNVFNIENEQDNDDFYIAMNKFQSQYLNPQVQPDGYCDEIDIEFSMKLNAWRLLK